MGVYPAEIRILKLLSLLALDRRDTFQRELESLNITQKDIAFLSDAFTQLEKTDMDSVILIFRSLLAAYPQESSEILLGLLLTDMIYTTSDTDWIQETYDIILPHLDDEILIIGFNQAYDMNKPQ